MKYSTMQYHPLIIYINFRVLAINFHQYICLFFYRNIANLISNRVTVYAKITEKAF